MKEFKAILDAYNKIDDPKRQIALAMVVKVKGSSYRSPGARMLITDDGRWVGTISGGCLEGDALRKARQVMQTGVPITITYDTSKEGDNNLGIGLGCNGIIDILIEPIDILNSKNPIKCIEKLVTFSDIGISATVFRSNSENIKVSDKWILDPEEEMISWNKDDHIPGFIKNGLTKSVEEAKPRTEVISYHGEEVEVFYEIIQPAISLTVFGGGFDVKPVVEIARMMSWNITVTDECVAHVAPSQFPGATSVLHCKKEFISREISLSPYSAAVIMSHSYEYDKSVIKQILDTNAFYVGVLGPRKRTDQIFDELEKEGIKIPNDFKKKLHSPIGLDIGAETSDEIAISIIGEILSQFSGRGGGLLKYRQGPIHERDRKSGQVFKEVYLKSNHAHKKSG